MSVQEYRDTGLVKISDDLKLDSLAGKSVLITGGRCWQVVSRLSNKPKVPVVLEKRIRRHLSQLG